jgi:beta-lactam-binding protein with PASTA domain
MTKSDKVCSVILVIFFIVILSFLFWRSTENDKYLQRNYMTEYYREQAVQALENQELSPTEINNLLKSESSAPFKELIERTPDNETKTKGIEIK